MKRKEILNQAEQCICNDREAQYGSPQKNFQGIADGLNWFFSMKYGYTKMSAGLFKAEDVPIIQAIVKLGRIATGKPKADNFVDGAGYIALAGEIVTEEECDTNPDNAKHVCGWCAGDWTDNFSVVDENFAKELPSRFIKFCPMCSRPLREGKDDERN